jgi:Eukaryotic phosphomannomutase
MLSLSFIRLHRRFISSINIISPLPRFVSTTMSELPTPENPRIAALFDVDGTLTIPRGEVKDDMMETLKELRKKITVGIVGGSDLPKQEEQLGNGIVNEVVWNFSQNGLVAYHNGVLLESNSIAKYLGEDTIKRIVNWVLKYLADLDLPVKVRIVLYETGGYCLVTFWICDNFSHVCTLPIFPARYLYRVSKWHAQYFSHWTQLLARGA